MVPILVIALIGLNKQKHWSMNTKEESTEKRCYSTVAPVYPRPSMHYTKELQTSKLKMQYYATIQTLELFHNSHNAYQQLHQKSVKASQAYKTRYTSYFSLHYPKLEIDNPPSRMHCLHYASSLYGKLGNEMTGRFNQDLPVNLQTAFEKAANSKPHIITKQSINERKVHEINHIDVAQCQEEIEINKVHIRNSNYKGKNYNPNYHQTKTNKTSVIVLAIQETTTKTMETKETAILRATIRTNQSMYQSH